MSIEITIMQKGLFKKPLPLEVICGSEMKYGKFDGMRLEQGKRGESEFILYHPAHIGRGCSVVWREGEKSKVSLRLPSPASEEEIDALYQTVQRIIEHWKACTITQDFEDLDPADLAAQLAPMKEFNLRALREMCTDPKGDLTLFCAFWPLILGEEEMARFAAAESLNDFRDYMHRMQELDVYYAKPVFYRKDDTFFGMYALTENTRSVFPIEPYVPFGVVDPKNRTPLEVENFYVTLISISENRRLGQICYQDMIENVEGKTYYDAGNVIIEDQPLSVLESLTSRFQTAIE